MALIKNLVKGEGAPRDVGGDRETPAQFGEASIGAGATEVYHEAVEGWKLPPGAGMDLVGEEGVTVGLVDIKAVGVEFPAVKV